MICTWFKSERDVYMHRFYKESRSETPYSTEELTIDRGGAGMQCVD
jgi:hypothetical protein